MRSASYAWLDHLADAMSSPVAEDFTIAGSNVKGVMSHDVTSHDFDMRMPVALSATLDTDYSALAAEAQYALDGGHDLSDLLESSPRMARWAREVHQGRVPGSPGIVHASHIKRIADNLLSDKTDYYMNTVSCGNTGLLNIGFATYKYNKQPLIGCRAMYANLNLAQDLPYEMFVAAILSWSLAALVNARCATKFGLGYCRVVCMDGFVDQMDMHATRQALSTVHHEYSTTMAGTLVDPLVGSRAEQKQAMSFALYACLRDVPLVGPGWDIRAGARVDRSPFPGNL